MEIKIDKPSFSLKKLEENLKNFNISIKSIALILITLIMVIIPILFLPYVYNETNQLRLTFYFTAIALLSFICIKIYEWYKNKKKINFKIKLDLVDIVLIIYSLLILISSLVSDYFPGTLTEGCYGRFEGALTLYLYIILFYIAYKTFDFKENYLPYLASSTLIVSTVGIIQAIFNLSSYKYMAVSSFGNPNFFSSYLSMMLPIYMVIYLKKGNNFYLITSVITFMALVCSKTLGGYITFVIYSIIIFIYAIATKVNCKRIIILLLLFAITFTLLNFCVNFSYSNEFISISEEATKINSNEFGTNRGLIYKIGLQIVKENFLLGVGPDSLGGEIMYKWWGTEAYTTNLLYDKAHSEYLHIAICTGVPSLVAYLIVIITIAIKMLKKFFSNVNNVEIFAVGMSIFAYLVQAVSNISVTHVAPLFWIVLGIGYGMCKSKTTEISK